MIHTLQFVKYLSALFCKNSDNTKIGGVGASISYAAFEKEGHFLSFR